jgi:hypothetical protein
VRTRRRSSPVASPGAWPSSCAPAARSPTRWAWILARGLPQRQECGDARVRRPGAARTPAGSAPAALNDGKIAMRCAGRWRSTATPLPCASEDERRAATAQQLGPVRWVV